LWTGDPGRPEARAVAIEGDRIVAVGSDDDGFRLASAMDVVARFDHPGERHGGKHGHRDHEQERLSAIGGLLVVEGRAEAHLAARVSGAMVAAWIR